ncbi:MAG: Flp family type IVb pilin [Magnetovibrio sp.]|nr:Flp family type IVb pilin [Magnetovibrio sp.]
MRIIRDIWNDRAGATAIEYMLIVALIGLVIIGAITLIGTDIANTFNDVANNF